MKLTQERVRELFDYRADGVLVRRVAVANAKVGDVASSRHNDGYVVVGIDGRSYRVHRVIFLWHHGYLPENGVDHINHIRDDNRIENLREVSQSCNLQNSKVSVRNKSGVRGVHYDEVAKKWITQIRHRGEAINMGRFDDLHTAALVRYVAEVQLGWETCNKDSTAFEYLREEKGLIWVHDISCAIFPDKFI